MDVDRSKTRARKTKKGTVRVRGIVVVGGHWGRFLPAETWGVGRRPPASSMASRDPLPRRIAVKSAGVVTAIRRIRGRHAGRFARFRVSAIGAHCLTSSHGAGLLFGGDNWVNVPGETEIIIAIV